MVLVVLFGGGGANQHYNGTNTIAFRGRKGD